MKKRFNTKVIHSGHGTDKETGGVMPPIHLSTTFKQNEPGEFKYEYARTKNPSRDVLENLLAELESGEQAFAFASGMAAINTVCDMLEVIIILYVQMMYMVGPEDSLIKLNPTLM